MVGGRLRNTQTKDGKVVDIGGQWVGPQQKKVLDLLKTLDIKTIEQFDEGMAVVDNFGKALTYKGIIPPLSWAALVDLQLALCKTSLSKEIDVFNRGY